ncbi:hypothetical protein PKHYL_05400 [Psychrobacter sp. KH172YL61]|nr:hypothetical protein PKHYL_05400 [Psychrobacter sp. KH172YL61]
MTHLFSKPLTLAAFMALGLVGCNNSSQTTAEAPAADDATTTEAAATDTNGTLQKIKDSGTIVVGHRDSSIPFSYIADDPNQPIGYAHDLEMKVVEAVKQKLNMPDLNVRYNLITSQTRIPLVQKRHGGF